MSWAWETGTPSERADMVRGHYGAVGLTNETVCELFHLTSDGLYKIARGDVWRPEHAVSYCRRGHPMTSANTHLEVDARGWKHNHCKTCIRENKARYRAAPIDQTGG